MYSCWSRGNAVNILVEISVMITYKLAWQNWSVQFIEILKFHTHVYIYIHKVGVLYICYLCVWAYMDTAMIHILILNTGNKVEECKGWHFLFMFHLKFYMNKCNLQNITAAFQKPHNEYMTKFHISGQVMQLL